MNAVEQQVHDLKNRVCGLMLIVVDMVQGKTLADISDSVKTDIEGLSA